MFHQQCFCIISNLIHLLQRTFWMGSNLISRSTCITLIQWKRMILNRIMATALIYTSLVPFERTTLYDHIGTTFVKTRLNIVRRDIQPQNDVSRHVVLSRDLLVGYGPKVDHLVATKRVSRLIYLLYLYLLSIARYYDLNIFWHHDLV